MGWKVQVKEQEKHRSLKIEEWVQQTFITQHKKKTTHGSGQRLHELKLKLSANPNLLNGTNRGGGTGERVKVGTLL